jgi:hypothetical protein
MAETYKTLSAAMARLENARRTMGRGNLYRIKNMRGGFAIACYTARPVICPAKVMAAGLPLALVDGDIRAFLGYF